MKTIHAVLAFLLLVPLYTQAEVDLAVWPKADPGFERFAVDLPRLEDEEAHRVEIVVGKTLSLDAGNQYFFGGTLKQETVKGYGYSLYRLEKVGPMAGTLMAVPDDVPKVDRFIRVNIGEAAFVSYNSKLPVVVYVPTSFEVKYRVWKAGEMQEAGRR